MQISTLSRNVSSRLAAFAWDEWAQMGVLAQPHRESPWAQDPEALVLFSLQVGRSDPRLFDEVLDWLALNAGLVSVQRLRNQYASSVDTRLGDAALLWVATHGGGVRVAPPPQWSPADPEALFYGSGTPSALDESFLAHGFAKPPTERTMKSQPPDTSKPIDFAFRLRSGLGVGSRAEVMRFLLTASVRSPLGTRPLFTTAAVADAAGFAKRNVQETLNALAAAGWIEQIVRGNERLYAVDPERWRSAFWVSDAPFPAYRDWTHALLALRELHRWLSDPRNGELTPYMRASEARRLMAAIEPSLAYAGISVRSSPTAEGAAYWDAFVDGVDQILAALESGLPW